MIYTSRLVMVDVVIFAGKYPIEKLIISHFLDFGGAYLFLQINVKKLNKYLWSMKNYIPSPMMSSDSETEVKL